MDPLYQDLRDRLGAPDWLSEGGVPRYGEFTPSLLGIYDQWAVLFEVECQACGEKFRVACGCPEWDLRDGGEDARGWRIDSVEDAINKLADWGDAPFHPENGQCSGTTMNAEIGEVLEVWKRGPSYGPWERVQ